MEDPARYRRRAAAVVTPAVGVAGVVAVWWAAVAVAHVQPYLLPAPTAVAAVVAHRPGYLVTHGLVTLMETVVGFGIAAAAGIAGGTALAASRWAERALTPVLVAVNAVPKVAFAPLLVVWLGFGSAPKVIMVVLMCFLPVVLSTVAGLGSTPADLVELARSLCCTRWQTFTRIRLEAAIPQIMVGVKTAMPLAVVGALVGELFGASAGLGFVIQTTGADATPAFAAVTVLAAMSIGLHYLLLAAERLLLPWVRQATPAR